MLITLLVESFTNENNSQKVIIKEAAKTIESITSFTMNQSKDLAESLYEIGEIMIWVIEDQIWQIDFLVIR